METLAAISEDEVIACFLRAEIDSPRWDQHLKSMLLRDRIAPRVLTDPDLQDAVENADRRRLLGEFRGWPKRLLFENFPKDVTWWRAVMTRQELLQVRYIDWPYWRGLSGGTRLARDAAVRIRQGHDEEHRHGYERIAERVRAGSLFPELIAVTGLRDERVVLVEGHARLTGYALAEDALAEEMELLLGRSASVARWGLF